MTIRAQLIGGFLVIILIFVLSFFINQKLAEDVKKNIVYLSNSESVIRNSNHLQLDVMAMQSGLRGFLLTEKTVFLEPYYNGLSSVPRVLADEKRLISDEGQLKLLGEIESLHNEWIEYADSLITSKADTLAAGKGRYSRLFESKLKMEVGKKLNDNIQARFSELNNNEYMLRLQRRDALQKSIERTRLISILLTAASIVLSLVLIFFLTRNISKRIGGMVQQAEKISEGEFIHIMDRGHDELSRLVKALNKMSATLDQNFRELKIKNKELDQFAYVVSHDLKAPLRGISNIVAWSEEDHGAELPPSLAGNLNLIKGRAVRLENMINGLLEYARIGKIKRTKEDVDTGKLVVELRDILVPSNFVFIVNGALPVLKAQKLQLEQVFSNLISNAVKYNDKQAPLITVTYKGLSSGEHLFEIKDNGMGIEPQYFDKIFMMFQTLQERDAFESTGVGLAIVKKIIDENKGRIMVESEKGAGSTFSFTWPQ